MLAEGRRNEHHPVATGDVLERRCGREVRLVVRVRPDAEQGTAAHETGSKSTITMRSNVPVPLSSARLISPHMRVTGGTVERAGCENSSMSDDYCYLITTGRRTGRPHRIEIWYANAGNTLYLLSGGGRSSDWVQNVLNDAAVMVEVDGVEHHAAAHVLAGDSDEAEPRETCLRQVRATCRGRPHRLASAITTRRPRPDRSMT